MCPYAPTVTPVQSICEQLLYEKAKNERHLRRLQFVWIERDPVLIQGAEFVRRISSTTIASMGSLGSVGPLDLEDKSDTDASTSFNESDDYSSPECNGDKALEQFVHNWQTGSQLGADASVDIVSQLLALIPPGMTTDEEMSDMYDLEEIECPHDESTNYTPNFSENKPDPVGRRLSEVSLVESLTKEEALDN